MQLQFSDSDKKKALQTLESIEETILHLIDWNKNICSSDDFYISQNGIQLLAADCTLITAIGEGINRINRVIPDFLMLNFPDIPWKAIIGMRNHIAHGYFEIDADIVFEAVKKDIPPLLEALHSAINKLNHS